MAYRPTWKRVALDIGGGLVILALMFWAALAFVGNAETAVAIGAPNSLSRKGFIWLFDQPWQIPLLLGLLLILVLAAIRLRLDGSLLAELAASRSHGRALGREEVASSVDAVRDQQNTSRNALDVWAEDKEPFVVMRTFPIGTTRTEVRIAVKNTGNGYLNEIEAKLVACEPTIGGHAHLPIFLGAFNLERNRHGLATLAYWDTNLSGTNNSDSVLKFPVSSGGLFGGIPMIALPTEASPAKITVECSAYGCITVRHVFKVWISGKATVHIEA